VGGTPVWKNAGYPMEGAAASANTNAANSAANGKNTNSGK
jgi:hypothetical protein